MTRYILVALAGLALSVDLAQADHGLPAFPGYPTEAAPVPTDRYGFTPFLRKGFWWKGASMSSGCTNCGSSSVGGVAFPPHHQTQPGYGLTPGIGYPGTPGYAMPGTLVFPNHPFMRSPRDFFMWEPNR